MNTFDELVGQLASLPDLPGARCRGRHELFDATIVGVRGAPPEDVEYARAAAAALCAQCPALHDCRQWLDNQPPNARPLGVIAGYVSTPKGLKPVPSIEAADNRRATSLVCHYGNANLEGINAILAEAVEVARVTPLFVGVLDLHEGIIPILLTEDGLACASQMVYSLTTDDDADTTRAAQLITAHSQRDRDDFNTLMSQAAGADRVTELLMAVLAVFRLVVPQLYCELGLTVLQRSIINWAAREENTDNDQEGTDQ